MKKVLIISPYFPPVNAADMQRVRMSLPYFKDFGWEAEVICVDEQFADIQKDPLLVQAVPTDSKIHKVAALSKKITGKMGLGSIALRSLIFIRKKGNTLLKEQRFDLVYFSTTQFPVCVLGAYWKRKFGVPYVIDMQDPWHSDYYRDKPKAQRPPKYWFSYRLNKWLEPLAMQNVGGLISVSEAYITTLKARYPVIKNVPEAVIPFAAFAPDQEIAQKNSGQFELLTDPSFINIVYVGRGGADMHKAISPVFAAMKKGLEKDHPHFSKLRFYFIGTSYAAADAARATIKPLAEAMDVAEFVMERPARIGFYHALFTLQNAHALLIPGSDDAAYTASKIYPYILAKKPLFAVVHEKSSIVNVLKECTNAEIAVLDEGEEILAKKASSFLSDACHDQTALPMINQSSFATYMAPEMTRKQIALFNAVLDSACT